MCCWVIWGRRLGTGAQRDENTRTLFHLPTVRFIPDYCLLLQVDGVQRSRCAVMFQTKHTHEHHTPLIGVSCLRLWSPTGGKITRWDIRCPQAGELQQTITRISFRRRISCAGRDETRWDELYLLAFNHEGHREITRCFICAIELLLRRWVRFTQNHFNITVSSLTSTSFPVSSVSEEAMQKREWCLRSSWCWLAANWPFRQKHTLHLRDSGTLILREITAVEPKMKQIIIIPFFILHAEVLLH